MPDNPPIIISVAPNGACKNKLYHANIPITPYELAIEAEKSMQAGASIIHLHIRDDNGEHSLDPDRYRDAINAIRDKVGDQLIIQITTESVGIYTTAEQMDIVRELKPESVSLALRELCPKGEENTARDFFKWVYNQKISIQYILYSTDDIKRFIHLHSQNVIPEECPHLLLVLGRYSKDQISNPNDILPMINAMDGFIANWSVCAFGAKESDCLLLSGKYGGHCRIGFENNILLPDGNIAPDNATLITNFVSRLPTIGRKLATVNETRKILNINH